MDNRWHLHIAGWQSRLGTVAVSFQCWHWGDEVVLVPSILMNHRTHSSCLHLLLVSISGDAITKDLSRQSIFSQSQFQVIFSEFQIFYEKVVPLYVLNYCCNDWYLGTVSICKYIYCFPQTIKVYTTNYIHHKVIFF